MTARTVRVYEILVDGPGEGPAGSGTYVRRTRDRREADRIAASSTCWGRPAQVTEVDAPRDLARRWGLA